MPLARISAMIGASAAARASARAARTRRAASRACGVTTVFIIIRALVPRRGNIIPYYLSCQNRWRGPPGRLMVPATDHDWRGRLITSRPRDDGQEFIDENRGARRQASEVSSNSLLPL